MQAVAQVAHTANASNNPDREQQYLGDLLTGVLNALQRTDDGRNSDHTDITYKVGAAGRPDAGIPGRELEIAMPPATAFASLQTVLLDNVLTNAMVSGNKPFIGYISTSICPLTNTLKGIQQFLPHSIMIEIVEYQKRQYGDGFHPAKGA